MNCCVPRLCKGKGRPLFQASGPRAIVTRTMKLKHLPRRGYELGMQTNRCLHQICVEEAEGGAERSDC